MNYGRIRIRRKKIEKLYTSLALANVKARFHFYLATDLYESRKEPDEGEIVEVVKMPFSQAYSMFVEEKKETVSYMPLGLFLAKIRLGLQKKYLAPGGSPKKRCKHKKIWG